MTNFDRRKQNIGFFEATNAHEALPKAAIRKNSVFAYVRVGPVNIVLSVSAKKTSAIAACKDKMYLTRNTFVF